VRVELDPEPQERPDITIRLLPGKLHELRLGGGVGFERQRQEVRARAEWTLRDFLGGLRTLRLRIRPAYVVIPSVSDPAQSGVAAINDLTLKQPDIFKSSITAQALVGYDLGIAEGYQYQGPRAQLALERSFFHDRVTGGASWTFQYLDFFNVNPFVFNPVTTPLGFGFQSPYRLGYLEQSVIFDIRDNPLETRWGGYALLRLEEGASAFGGQFEYIKPTFEGRGYVPISKRLTLALRGLWGWLAPNTQVDSPITRRFTLGGPSSHRGFGFGRLSPQVLDTMTGRRVPVGGDAEVLFSGEVRADLFKLYGSWVGIVPFFDAGDVTPDISQLDMGDLNYATGMQVDYATPIGVARVGLGIRLNRLGLFGPNGLMNADPGDRYAFFFSIGEAF
jgi:outer membrane translocation and assembly module TamA